VTSGGSINYNFAGIEADSGDISAAVGKVNGLLAEGQGALNRLQGTWRGDGAMSYEAVQQRWNQNSEELNLALQSLAHAVRDSGVDMGGTEQNVMGMFT
jgi:early secretory antigenic target protein ESAT-6